MMERRATDLSHQRASRLLYAILATAVAVSVVHYVDNYVNYDDYPQPDPGSALPAPSASLIAFSWFVFTGFGVLAVLLWRNRRITSASFALAGYSISGLIGLGHYTIHGATDMVWWRQAHVIVDIICGIAVLGYALWAARNASRLTAPGSR